MTKVGTAVAGGFMEAASFFDRLIKDGVSNEKALAASTACCPLSAMTTPAPEGSISSAMIS